MKFWIHIPLFTLLLLQSSVYASIELQGRKHSTAHSFPNGTIVILGGIEFALPNATHSQLASSILTLRVDTKDFSLYSTDAILSNKSESLNSFPPTTGHTSHLHVPFNSIITCFGLQQHSKASPPLIPSPSSSSFNNKTIPTGRHQHTSALINDNLYVIGGKDDTSNRLIDSLDMMWSYSFSTDSWKKFNNIADLSSRAGHTTVVHKNRWLISCFGLQNGGIVNDCTWFDTVSFNLKKITPSSIKEWPTARLYANMISHPNNNSEFILFGGESPNDTIFDDVWKLGVNASSYTMIWTKIDYKRVHDYNYRRSGHASALISENNVILYYGGQSNSQSITVTDPIYLDISKMEWIETKNMKSDLVGTTTHRNGVDLINNVATTSGEESHGLSGGAIGGIIVGVIGVCAVGIGFLVWKKRRQRQQNIYQKSRAARFSQSPTPMYSVKQREREVTQPGDSYTNEYEKGESTINSLANKNTLSLPELALTHHNDHSRISTLSLGAEFRFYPDDYRCQSQRSSKVNVPKEKDNISNIDLSKRTESVNSLSNSSGLVSRQQLESLSEEEDKLPSSSNYKRRESTGFKRLTLNLFSSSQNDQATDKKKDRSSSLFQLRASKLLQPNTPATPDGRYPFSTERGSQSRVSLGAKSVSSVQWVGFNDGMDFKGNSWRSSSASSMHLAVKNARASSYYTSESSQSTPRSPMFPHHLRDSTSQYNINELEASSWKVGINKEPTSTVNS